MNGLAEPRRTDVGGPHAHRHSHPTGSGPQGPSKSNEEITSFSFPTTPTSISQSPTLSIYLHPPPPHSLSASPLPPPPPPPPLVTLVYLRSSFRTRPCRLYQVDRSTITRAIARSARCSRPASPCPPPRPAAATLPTCRLRRRRSVKLRLDGRKCRSAPARRKPAAAPSSGKKKMNTKSHRDHRRKPHLVRAFRPGRMHDQTAVRTEASPTCSASTPRSSQSRRRYRDCQGVPGPSRHRR